MAPTKRTLPAGTSCSTTQLVEEGNKLLELSKKWRMEIIGAMKAETPVLELSTTVASALDHLASAKVSAIDKIKTNAVGIKTAIRGTDLANVMAEKALSAATDARKETASLTELANKRLKELSLRTKSNLSHIQRLELARSENIVIAKGIPPCMNGKETHEELRRVVDMAFQSTGARGITVTYIRRLQRVQRDSTIYRY